MSKLLTVAIPSYNRAAELDRQLGWVRRNIVGLECDCEVIVSDNAATDTTPQVCRRWQAEFASAGVAFRLNRNEVNRGPLPNIAKCIDLASGRFCWVIGDDDEIPDGKLAWVIARLRGDPDLASIVLNFEGIGKTVFDKSFHFETDQYGDGKEVIEKILRQAYNGLGFMSAQIYRTEFAQEALKVWPTGTSNYDSQIYVSAYTGMRGKVLATRDTHMQYVTGNNIYEKNKQVGMILAVDTLQVFIHLHRVGFSGKLCRSLALRHVLAIKRRVFDCAIRINPLITITQAARASVYLLALALG